MLDVSKSLQVVVLLSEYVSPARTAVPCRITSLSAEMKLHSSGHPGVLGAPRPFDLFYFLAPQGLVPYFAINHFC